MREVVEVEAMNSIAGRERVVAALGQEPVLEVLLKGNVVTVDTPTRSIRAVSIFGWGYRGSGSIELARLFSAIGWSYDEAFCEARLTDGRTYKITPLSWSEVVAGESVR